MAAYFFASPVDVDIKLEGEDDRKQVEVKLEKEKSIRCPVYYDGESVVGQVRCALQITVWRVHLTPRNNLRLLCAFATERRSRMTASKLSLWELLVRQPHSCLSAQYLRFTSHRTIL